MLGRSDLFTVIGICDDLVDLDGRKFLDVETFAAVIANFSGIQIANHAFETPVALFFVVEDAHFRLHVSPLPLL